jgi:hypothetical protein
MPRPIIGDERCNSSMEVAELDHALSRIEIGESEIQIIFAGLPIVD